MGKMAGMAWVGVLMTGVTLTGCQSGGDKKAVADTRVPTTNAQVAGNTAAPNNGWSNQPVRGWTTSPTDPSMRSGTPVGQPSGQASSTYTGQPVTGSSTLSSTGAVGTTSNQNATPGYAGFANPSQNTLSSGTNRYTMPSNATTYNQSSGTTYGGPSTTSSAAGNTNTYNAAGGYNTGTSSTALPVNNSVTRQTSWGTQPVGDASSSQGSSLAMPNSSSTQRSVTPATPTSQPDTPPNWGTNATSAGPNIVQSPSWGTNATSAAPNLGQPSAVAGSNSWNNTSTTNNTMRPLVPATTTSNYTTIDSSVPRPNLPVRTGNGDE
jgi:hypothetical protein